MSLRRSLSKSILPMLACMAAIGISPRAGADEADVCITAAEEAQPLRRENKLRLAREKLLICSRALCPEVVSGDCKRWLSDVESKLSSIAVRVTDSANHELQTARIAVDDEVVNPGVRGEVFLEPGKHKLHVESAGAKDFDADFVLKRGERGRPLVAIVGPLTEGGATSDKPKSPTSSDERGASGARAAAFVLGGVGVAAIGVGTYFWISGRSDYSNLRSTCGETHTCAESDVHSMKTKLQVGDVLFGAGLISFGAGLWLGLSSSSKEASSALGFAPSPGGALLSYTANFR